MTSEWFDNVCMSALGHRTSQEMTYDLARLALVRGIPGDFVECGVYAGASCALMARALMDHYGENFSYGVGHRRVHLFDSFAGIPKPGPYDVELAGNVGGESACSIEDVRKNMQRWGISDALIVYHPGDFSVTVPAFAARLIALLRLDGDLYESTKACLQYLEPMVSRGGYIILDDHNLTGARIAMLQHYENNGPAPIIWRKPE